MSYTFSTSGQTLETTVGLTADIEKAFFTVGIQADHLLPSILFF